MPRRTFHERLLEISPRYSTACLQEMLPKDEGWFIFGEWPPPSLENVLRSEIVHSRVHIACYMNELESLFKDGTLPRYGLAYFQHEGQVPIYENMNSGDELLFSDFNIFHKYMETILKVGVFSKLVPIEAIIEYGDNEEEIRRTIAHYGIVHRIPELNLEYDEIENGCLPDWYEKIKNYIGFDSVKDTKDWLDKVVETENPIYISEDLDFILENGIEVGSYSGLLSLLADYGFMDCVDLIEPIFWADIPNEEKKLLFEKVNENRRLLEFLSVDSVDVDSWIDRATKKGESYLNEEFGLTEKYSLAVNIRVQDVVNESDLGGVLRQVLQLEERGGYNLAGFERGKLHSRRKTNFMDTSLDPTDATRLLVYGLISRKKKRIDLAKQVYDGSTVSVARRYISKSHLRPGKLFQLVKGNLQILEGDFSYENKLKSARLIIEKLREVYFSNTEYDPERFQLLNLVRSVEGLSGHTDSFDELVSQMQEYRLMDMFGGTRLMCCAFLSEDRERKEAEAVLYQADPYIGLEQIVPYKDGVRVGEPIGVSILANCETKDNCSVLLVDSAEGGSILQGISKRVYLPLFLEGIIGSAEDSGSEMIFVPQKAVNGIAKQFRDYFKSVVGQSKPENRYLSKLRGDGGLVIPQEKRFLEAFEDREKLSEEISGYCVRVEELKLMQF